MSLNVNEMELKDPMRRTCGCSLYKEKRKLEKKKKNKSAIKKKEEDVKAVIVCGSINI